MPVVNPSWSQKYPNNSPSERVYNVITYDGNNKNVVLFGGFNPSVSNIPNNETWIWNGNNWIQKFPTNSPSERLLPVITYDDNNKNVVLFGGSQNNRMNSNNSYLNDTWIWDGNNWIQKFPADSPSLGVDYDMTYDYSNKNVVLLGSKNDTWIWNGNNWTQKFPINSPGITIYGTMSYDHTNKNVVLFGGTEETLNSSEKIKKTTYIWDGNNWIQKFPVNSPQISVFASSTYDFYSKSIILYGGADITEGNAVLYGDTWSWDGNNWTQIITSSSPSASISNITYDLNNNNIVLFGGGSIINSNDIFYKDTWIFTSDNTSNTYTYKIIKEQILTLRDKCYSNQYISKEVIKTLVNNNYNNVEAFQIYLFYVKRYNLILLNNNSFNQYWFSIKK